MSSTHHRLALAVVTAALGHAAYTFGTLRTEHGVTIASKHPSSTMMGQYFALVDKYGWCKLTRNCWLQLDDRTDVYQELRCEQPCSLRVYGWRIRQLGLYPNIVQVVTPEELASHAKSESGLGSAWILPV